MSFAERLLSINRRVIFLLVGLAVIIPLLLRFTLPTSVTPPVKRVFDFIETSPEFAEGKALLVSVDYDPATTPELYPMTLALLRHAFSKNVRVLLMTLHPAGSGLAEMAVAQVSKEYDVKRGTDYVFLGFKPGLAAVLLGMGEDIYSTFPTDYYGTPISEIPMMRNIQNYDNIALVTSIAASSLPESWISYAGARYGQRVATGVTAVMASDFYPYLQTGQLIGLLGGLKGAAEYEKLLDESAEERAMDAQRRELLSDEEYELLRRSHRVARVGMVPQSIVHILIVVLIIMGNVGYFAMRRAKRS